MGDQFCSVIRLFQCQLLDSGSLANVAEERYLGRLCGWPLCDWPVDHDRKTQQFAIRGRRVFNVERRRWFCSDRCLAHFTHLEGQLPTEALWLTGQRHAVEITLDEQALR